MNRYEITGSYSDSQLVKLSSIQDLKEAKIVRFYSAGQGTWKVPSGVTSIDICLVGGGGASGRWLSWTHGCGGPGGGGQVLNTYNHLVTPGETLSYIVAKGGSGGVGDVGNPGQLSSVFRTSTSILSINSTPGMGGGPSSVQKTGFPGQGGNGAKNTAQDIRSQNDAINHSNNGLNYDSSKSIYEFDDTSLLSHAAPGFYWTSIGFKYTSTANVNNGAGTGGAWQTNVSRDGYGGQGAGGGAGGGPSSTGAYNTGGDGAVIIRYII